MSFEQHDSGPTSNDLLESLIADRASAALSDQTSSPDPILAVVAESAQLVQSGVESIEDAPAAGSSGAQALE
jgi:hypothetical protein